MPVGGGIGLLRMALLSCSGLGLGLSDVFFGAFILDALRLFGASKFLAFSAIAAGSAASIFFAPLAGAFGGRSVFHRKWTTIFCFTIAAMASSCIGFFGRRGLWYDEDSLGPWSPESAPEGHEHLKIALLFIFAAVYRAATQASPAVPMVIDAAHHRTKGTQESSVARIKIGVSWWYFWNRLGIAAALLVLILLPERGVAKIFLPYFIASIVFFVTIALTAVFMPTKNLGMDMQMHDAPMQMHDAPMQMHDVPLAMGSDATAGETEDGMQQSPKLGEPAPPPPPRSNVLPTVASDLKIVTALASRPLKYLFVQTFFFGISNGLLRVIIAPYFNEIALRYNPMGADGIAWMTYSGIMAWGVGFVHDAVIGTLALASTFRSYGVTLFWASELFLGSAIFVSLYFIRTQIVGFAAFSSLAIAISSQSFFNLVAAGALPPQPRLRPATFGIRAACLNGGELLGSLAAAAIERKNDITGFREVMLLSAGALAVAAVAAIAVGTPEIPRFSDLPVNANPLVAFLTNKEDEDVFVQKLTAKAQ